MAKARLTVQEPTDSLIMAPPQTKHKSAVYIDGKLRSTIKVGGVEQTFTQPEDGIIGFMIVFDDYEKALKWVNGDTKQIITGMRTT
jgi:hypothetical protein